MQTQDKFDLWCIVELFGHQKIAGRCTEQNIAGTNFLRVDVPETETQPSFTKFFGASAIYAINPVDEVTAKHFVDKLEAKPIESWNISEIIKKNQDKLLMNQSVVPAPMIDDEDEYNDENAKAFEDDIPKPPIPLDDLPF